MDDIAGTRAASLSVELAGAADVPAIERMVDAAYSKYVERLGRLPAAMTADHGALVERGGVHVLRAGGRIVGSVFLAREGDAIQINNLVVAPAAQGRDYGRLLMARAEEMARAQALAAVTLFTNVMMHENIALYAKLGFVETGRRTQGGFDRVFFRKDIV